MINFSYLLFFVFFFVLGSFIGSFLNVIILRYGTGKSFAKGRSECFSCRKPLVWYELIPVLSFLFQLGRCRECKSTISYQYPIVEFITGLIFAFTALKFSSFTELGLVFNTYEVVSYFILFSLLIVIAVYDMRHKIIPDLLSFLFGFVALLKFIIDNHTHLFVYPTYLNLLAGPLLALPFAFLFFVSRGMWMGFGDAKLALGIGWFLGLTAGLTSITLAFWSGAVISLILIGLQKAKHRFFKKRLSLKSEIPFAPFLILGLLITFFLSVDLYAILLV